MFLFIAGIVVFIVAIVILIASSSTRETGGIIGGVVGVLVGIVLFFMSFMKTVDVANTGIVTTFGRVEDYTLESGVHFMAPWKKVTQMDNRVQKETLNLSCFSSDIQEVSVVYTINYQIDKKNAQNIYKNIGTKYFETVVQPKALEALKGVFAKYTAENIIAQRSNLSAEVEIEIENSLEGCNIEIVSTSIEDIDFTDAFTNAVEAKTVAEQNKLKAQTEQEQAIIEANASAEKKRIEAQANADSAIIAAEADANIAKIAADSAEYQGQKDAAIMSNIGRQLQDYPQLITYYRVTNWNGVMPQTMLSDNTDIILGGE